VSPRTESPNGPGADARRLAETERDAGAGMGNSAHRAEAFAVVFSPDGKQIATGGSDGIRLWDAETGKELKTLNAGRRTNSLAWLMPLAADAARLDVGVRTTFPSVGHGGTTLFACCHDFVSAWNIETGEALFHQALDRTNGWRMALSPDGQQFAVGLKTGGIQLRSAEHGGLLFTLDPKSKDNYDVAFSPGGLQLFVASNEKCLTIYDLKTRAQLRRFDKYDWPVFSVALCPSGNQFATGWGTWTFDSPGGVTIHDTSTGTVVRTLGAPSSAAAYEATRQKISPGKKASRPK
ncbi:MAG: hypothetical protein HZA46_17830, partial [Planctomycetales bacterium]|nr:hypothetical protein [Planctomycetales bacterium]